MKLLVIGSGGREHALTWALLKSPRTTHIYVAPGNGGTATMDRVTNVPISDPTALLAFAQEQSIDLTVVGPEAPLAAGVVDLFQDAGLKIFGPRQNAAQLESSKDYAKAFMQQHAIPTAAYQTFTDPKLAHDYIDTQGAPIVVKADGLAAGKGVVVATTLDQAHEAVDSMLGDGSLGAAGARVVIEDCLIGEEASFIVMADGRHILPLASSQDHKRLLDADQGPNTGGMGAYSPAPVVSPVLHERIMSEVIEPTIKAMADQGIPYTGFLYAGVMIGPGDDATRPIGVLEFNCRMGDPETQPILMRLQSDLLTLIEAAVNQQLDRQTLEWHPSTALCVVMASHGYPAKARTGDVITDNSAKTEQVMVFHAGTSLDDSGQLITAGGRVLGVTALGKDVAQARDLAYATIADIEFDGAQFRTDIAWRALQQ
ncbi:MAG: phosphoribosylamine--glycine ligase [Orrella sp.]